MILKQQTSDKLQFVAEWRDNSMPRVNDKLKFVGQKVATMKASVLCVGRLEVRDVPQPSVSPYDVLVRVSAVGICGTDSHIFAGHANYNTDQQGQPIPLNVEPQILGHEINGYVVEKGSEVKDHKS